MTMHQLTKSGPSPGVRSQQFWRTHIDKVAVQRVQTPQQLALRRKALLAAVADYLAIAAGEQARLALKAQPKPKTKAGLRSRLRGNAGTFSIARAQFKTKWRCDDAWLATIVDISRNFELPPTVFALARFLEFPAPDTEEPSRPRRKKSSD